MAEDILLLQNIIAALVAFLLMLAGYLMLAPVGECPSCVHCSKARVKGTEFCKLHARPVTECVDQHKPDA